MFDFFVFCLFGSLVSLRSVSTGSSVELHNHIWITSMPVAAAVISDGCRRTVGCKCTESPDKLEVHGQETA